MNMHHNARLTPRGREILVRRIVDDGLRPEEAAQAAGVSVRTAYKWLARYRAEGLAGLRDRSSRPFGCPHQASAAQCQQLIELRRQRRTYRQISQTVGVAESTVSRVLRRAGLNRLSALEPARPTNRYVHDHPGDLLHLDVKKLGRFERPGHRVTGDRRNTPKHGPGWEYVHVAIDYRSRTGFTTLHADERGVSACRALIAAARYYAGFGITIRRVLTDNGACYKSRVFRRLCRRLGIEHRRTRPYSPRTNGKAERFIQTLLREWAYARSYPSSDQRAAAMPAWLHHYTSTSKGAEDHVRVICGRRDRCCQGACGCGGTGHAAAGGTFCR